MRHIDSVIEGNKAAGGTFFDKRTVCYFKNKVLPTMYGGKYFISYDVMEDGEKLYTVRKVLASGLIGHEGPRNAFASKDAALSAIRELLGDAVTA
jgi:hypothetical protein